VSADKKKKILFVITKSNWGGAQRYLYDLATHLAAEGNDVSVAFGPPVGGDGELAKRLNIAGIKKIYELSSGRDIKIFEEIKTFFSILWIIWNERPDVIHLNSSKIGGLGGFAAWLTRVPKIIFTAHGWAYDEDRSWWQKKLIIFFSWLSSIFHHQIICVSEHSRTSGKRLGSGYKKCLTIHNAIEEVDFFSRDEAGKFFAETLSFKPANNTIWIGTIAELTKNKGLPYLVAALAILESKNWLCLLIGSGEQYDELKHQINALKLGDKIFIINYLPEAARYLRAFDIFVMSSVKEGLPYVLLEAGLAGLAIAATNVGGIPEIIENKKTGLLSPPKYPRALADQIERLIGDEKLRDTLGKNLRHKIASDFKFDIMLERTKQVYEK